jgi:hypothetical protein
MRLESAAVHNFSHHWGVPPCPHRKSRSCCSSPCPPWANDIYARALLRTADKRLQALFGGDLRLEKGETLNEQGNSVPLEVTRYELIGIDLDPETVLLDAINNEASRRTRPTGGGLRKQSRQLLMILAHAAVVPAFLHVLRCNDRCSTCIHGVISVVAWKSRVSAPSARCA